MTQQLTPVGPFASTESAFCFHISVHQRTHLTLFLAAEIAAALFVFLAIDLAACIALLKNGQSR